MLISCLSLHAQTPLQLSFRHLTQQQGLPSSYCSLLFKDSRHFWWIGTQSGGLVRFDGQTCKTYPSFAGSNIVNILEDKDGNLWVGSNKGLNFYDRRTDQFKLINIPGLKTDCWLKPIYFDDQGRLWLFLACQWGLHILNTKTLACQLVDNQLSEQCKIFPNTPYQKPQFLLTNASEGFVKADLQGDKVIKSQSFFDRKSTSKLPVAEIADRYFAESDTLVWLGTNLGMIAFNPQKQTFRLYNRFQEKAIGNVTHIAFWGKHHLFVGTAEEGVLLFDRQQQKFVQQFKNHATEPNSLASNEIDKILVDDQRNMIVSVVGYGIDYTNLDQIRLPYFLTKSDAFEQGITDNHITCAVESHNGMVYLGTKNDGVLVMNTQGRFVQKLKQNVLQSTYIKHLFEDSQQRLWVATKDGVQVIEGKKAVAVLRGEGVNHVSELDSKTFFVATHRNVYVVKQQATGWSLTPIEQVFNEGHRYNLFVWVHPLTHQPYLTTESGSYLCELIQDKATWKFGKTVWLPAMTMDAPFKIDRDSLWFGGTDGIVKLSLKTWQTQLDRSVSGRQLKKVMIDAKGLAWFVTEKEVFSWDAQHRKKESFGMADGLSTTYFETNACITLRNGRLLLGGTNGFNLFDPVHIAPHPGKGKILLTGIQFNDKNIMFGEGKLPEVGYNENTVSFDFVAQDITLPDGAVLEYQLENYDTEWLTSPAKGFVRYAKLPAGKFVFKVRFVGEPQTQLTVPIEVASPIWLTWWFRASLVVVLMGAGYAIYRSKINEERQRSEIKRMRAEAEMKAFRAQMNPHFVFNCMNTIDGYVLSNRPEQASLFLQKFSRLIRLVLENSQKDLIPISEELKALELYIQLEQERMQQGFTCQIEVASDVNTEILCIPPLLLQPFVENAILHGLRHKTDGPGLLSLRVSKNDALLLIEIEDNGVGRKAAAEINRQKKQFTQSMGIEVTSERIDTLTALYGKNATFEIQDISQQGQTGTRVIIELPLLRKV